MMDATHDNERLKMNALGELYAKAAVDQLAFLADVLSRWQATGDEPAVVGGLSAGERAALLLAMKQEHRLESPLAAFMLLDDPLQRFVLEQRGWKRFVGRPLAVGAY